MSSSPLLTPVSEIEASRQRANSSDAKDIFFRVVLKWVCDRWERGGMNLPDCHNKMPQVGWLA